MPTGRMKAPVRWAISAEPLSAGINSGILAAGAFRKDNKCEAVFHVLFHQTDGFRSATPW